MSALRITEIFYSIQGESNLAGWPTVFVRLTGCPLRCQYCDTTYAFHGGKKMELAEILQEVARYSPRYVCVTGGEPLAQRECLTLLTALCDQGYVVSLETSGALDVSAVDPRVIKVIDLKTPGSTESKQNLWSNLNYLSAEDQIKIVICDQADYEWAKQIVVEKELTEKTQVLFSPSYRELSAEQLADWILRDRIPVRLQVQLHKTIWGDIPGK
jgi:7-carboxy-7-deazaguanine synthase